MLIFKVSFFFDYRILQSFHANLLNPQNSMLWLRPPSIHPRPSYIFFLIPPSFVSITSHSNQTTVTREQNISPLGMRRKIHRRPTAVLLTSLKVMFNWHLFFLPLAKRRCLDRVVTNLNMAFFFTCDNGNV